MVKSNLSATAAAWIPSFGMTPPTAASSSSNTPLQTNSTTICNDSANLEQPLETMTIASPAPALETPVSTSPAIISPTPPATTTVTAPASVWGKKPSDAIKQPPPAEMIHLNPKHVTHSDHVASAGKHSQTTEKFKQGSSSRSHPTHGDSGKRIDNGRGNKHTKEGPSRDDNSQKGGWKRGRLLPLPLIEPGEGSTDSNRQIPRFSFADLLALRLSHVSPPLHWESSDDPNDGRPPEECKWTDDTRLQQIISFTNAERSMTDPSERLKKKTTNANDTAPAMEECKPLEINDDTRWKAHVFKKDQQTVDEDSDEIVLKKALLILNKLSLTKFEKLSDVFIQTGVGRNETCLTGAIRLIVKKAQDEPHFSSMYAALCLKLSRTPVDFEEPGKNKMFKKMLLTECQKEFEEEMETKISKAIEGIEDEEERDIKTALVKKHYLGHMRFIGELYKGDLISAKIMIVLLPQLLEGRDNEGKVDEEKVECFAKLMTVIGQIIEQQGEAMNALGKPDIKNKLYECWIKVEVMAGKAKGSPSVSSRIKFMLLDLLEMRANGWASRREEESAKTIAQIHREAARDVTAVRRSTTSGSSRKQVMKPIIDEDGFTTVVGGSGSKSSASSKFDAKTISTMKTSDLLSSAPRFEVETTTPKPIDRIPPMTAKEYVKKSKTLFKEFFIGGDEDDAVLSIQEMIGADLSVERGAKAFEGGVLLVLEMRTEEVTKFVKLMSRCFREKIIRAESILMGLSEPLEYLSDVAIDAPLAITHMVDIVAAFIRNGAVAFNFLLDSPEYFRTDCNAASFGRQVLKVLGENFTSDESNLEVISNLMTTEERAKFNSAQEFLSA